MPIICQLGWGDNNDHDKLCFHEERTASVEQTQTRNYNTVFEEDWASAGHEVGQQDLTSGMDQQRPPRETGIKMKSGPRGTCKGA